MYLFFFRQLRSFFRTVPGFFLIVVLSSCVHGDFSDTQAQDRKTIAVSRGGDFQAALNKARPGDTIVLEAGATFTGAFKLLKKDGADFITVRSSAPDKDLPAAGERLDPTRYKAALAKLQSNVKGEPGLLAVDGAHHYRFIGIEFGPTVDGLYNIIQLGTGTEESVDQLPHHIEFDRVFIHGDPNLGQRRGIAANGRHIKIENSYISDIKRRGEESQAIGVWATDGPVEIVNNYLEAAAENILFGGADSKLQLVPTDCIVRDNHLNKPIEWQSTDWVVKNRFEIKHGRNIRVTNNLMTNNWAMGQDGSAVLFTTRLDSGPNVLIEDIQFSGNILRGSANGFNIWGGEGRGGRRLTISNNLIYDIGGPKWKSPGHFMKVSTWDGLTIERNTVIQAGNIANAYDGPVTGFKFHDNIIFENEYGIKGDAMGSGQEVIMKYFSGGSVSNNVIIGANPSRYREHNFYPVAIRQVGFVDPANSDYRLRPDSPFLSKGTGGSRIGSDLDPTTVGRRYERR